MKPKNYFESEPKKYPVLVWYTGKDGCSSWVCADSLREVAKYIWWLPMPPPPPNK
jgi:hypothetical protein